MADMVETGGTEGEDRELSLPQRCLLTHASAAEGMCRHFLNTGLKGLERL